MERECTMPSDGNAGQTMVCSSCLTLCMLKANQRGNAHGQPTQHTPDHVRSATCRRREARVLPRAAAAWAGRGLPHCRGAWRAGPARGGGAPPREPASRLALFYILTSTPLEFNMSHSPPLSERARLLRVLCRVLLAQLLLPPQVVHGISPVTISTHGKHIGGRAHHTT
jgi:hypothetical protein